MKTITLDPPKNISDTFLKSINYEDGLDMLMDIGQYTANSPYVFRG